MKVLQINAINKNKSTGRNVYEIATYLNENGHVGKVACALSTGDKDEYVIGTAVDHKIHAFLSRLTGKQACFSTRATRQLISYIEKEQFDVIHINNVHSNYVDLPQLLDFLAKKNLATVITLHDCWFYTGHCFHYTLQGCYKWEKRCEHCPQIHGGNSSWLFDTSNLMHKMKEDKFGQISRLAVVGVSDWITKEAKKSFLGRSSIVGRVYNWVDMQVFAPKTEQEVQQIKHRLGIDDKCIVLGVASEWSESKGLTSFVKLAQQLDEDYRVVLVGRMPEGYVLPENIISLTEIHDVVEMANIYGMADVFVTFSREESFGKVSAEALACGTPIICYNSTANPELVGEGCGYVLQTDEIMEAMNRIREIHEHGRLYYEKNCVEYASKNFEMEACIQSYISIYEQLLKI